MKIRTVFLILCVSLAACDQTPADLPGSRPGDDIRHLGDYNVNGRLVYCGRQIIQEADGARFEYLGSQSIDYNGIHYGKDDTHVYTCDVRTPTILSPAKPRQTIVKKLENANPETFALLTLGYAKDDKSVFYGTDLVAGADAANFKILKNDYVVYGFDGRHIYHDNKKLPVKDPAGFRLLGGVFATDNHHVYAERTRITIHPHQAEIMTYRLIRDTKNVYYMNRRILGADACSFAPGGEYEDSMDKVHFYYEGSPWDLSDNKDYNALRLKAHALWKKYYAEYRKNNRSGCPRKRVVIPRHDGDIKIVDLVISDTNN